MCVTLIKIKQKNKLANGILFIIFLILFLIFLNYFLLASPSPNKDNTVHISYGESLDKVSVNLENMGVVKNAFILKIFVHLFKSNGGITDGDYLIMKNTPVYKVARQIVYGHHNTEPIKVTLNEGLNNQEISDILDQKLAGFKKDSFLLSVKDKQGYLFPDTYFFYPLTTSDEIVNQLENNFDKKIKPLNIKNKENFNDIIIMASILEGEANGEEDVSVISGILWKRISMGMPLQVDVDKNTYKEKGLPDEPLNNPGLSSIKASLNPVSSSYLYYLHDSDGGVHYAKTFEEHKINIKKYLR